MWETWVWSLSREDPLEEEMATPPVLLPGESHGQRSLAGYSPWGCKESNPTEQLTQTHQQHERLNLKNYKEQVSPCYGLNKCLCTLKIHGLKPKGRSLWHGSEVLMVGLEPL